MPELVVFIFREILQRPMLFENRLAKKKKKKRAMNKCIGDIIKTLVSGQKPLQTEPDTHTVTLKKNPYSINEPVVSIRRIVHQSTIVQLSVEKFLSYS